MCLNYLLILNLIIGWHQTVLTFSFPSSLVKSLILSAGTTSLSPSDINSSKSKVLVVGDPMLDRYIYGTVHGISPEAPIPILSVERQTEMPGGTANVVANLLALGAQVIFVTVNLILQQ